MKSKLPNTSFLSGLAVILFVQLMPLDSSFELLGSLTVGTIERGCLVYLLICNFGIFDVPVFSKLTKWLKPE